MEKRVKTRKAKWLRIKVVENGKKKFSMRLPLGLISVTVAALNPVLKWGLRRAAQKDEKLAMIDIDKIDLRMILKVLASYGPMTFVEVKDRDNEVIIQSL